MMNDQSSFADRLKDRMTLLGLSPNQLAKKSKVSSATIYRILSGDIDQLRTDSLVKLADTLDTTIDYLSGRVPEQTADRAIQIDRNAEYIFQLYSQMNVAQAQQLMQFAEFTKYRNFNVKDLLRDYTQLYQFCLDSMKEKKWDDTDPRFQKAVEFMAEVAIRLALQEEDEGETDK